MRLAFKNLPLGWICVCVALFVVSMSCFPIQSEDLFMYLAIAREFFKDHVFPAQDPFLYSIPHYSWTIFHQWLGYLAYYGLYVLGGFPLIILAKTFLITATFCVPVLKIKASREAVFFWGLSVLLAVFAMSFRMMERTSLFSDFLAVAVLTILLRGQENLSTPWKYALPGIFALWVNLHPGFPVGWLLYGGFLLVNLKSEARAEYRKWAALVLASVLVCFLNPKGVEGFLYPFQFASHEGKVFREYYFEWMPTLHPLYRTQPPIYFIFALIAVNVFLLYRARKTRPFFELGASVFFIFYGLYAIRFVPSLCFALVSLNAALALKADLAAFPFLRRRALGALGVVALALAVKNVFWGYETLAGPREFGLGMDPRLVPEKAASLLKDSGLPGNIYNSHLFGGYLAWAWEGKPKIIYHGFLTDTDFFLREYRGFSMNRERFDLQVDKYGIGAFLLDRFRGNEELLEILVRHPRWQLVYKDEGSLIFLRKRE